MPATRGVQRFTLGGLPAGTASCIAAEQRGGARAVGSAAAHRHKQGHKNTNAECEATQTTYSVSGAAELSRR